MKLRLTIAMLITVAQVTYVNAQDASDALRYSQTFFGGSARSMGMAGSFSALGADVGAMTTNPAGLARFSKSSFSFSMGPQNTNYSSTYNLNSSSSSRTSFPVQGLALVIHTPKMNEYGWKSVQSTFAYNRLASFNAQRHYEGYNFQSLLGAYSAEGFGVSPSSLWDYNRFTTWMAYETYAIDDYQTALGIEYFPRINEGDSIYHKQTINSNGGISEYSYALSGNYNNTLYIGGSINLQNIRYNEDKFHNEQMLQSSGLSLKSFDYDFSYQSRGLGVNGRLGMIWLPTDEMRVGFAVHTPTVMRFNEEFSAGMTAVHDFGTIAVDGNSRPSGDFKYRFRSPLRMTGSLAYVFEKRLAMNVDLELVDYSASELLSSNNIFYQSNFVNQNARISDFYRRVLNTRLGLEYAMTPEWFVRCGYALYPRAISNRHKNAAEGNHFFGAGIGYRKGTFSIDLAYLQHRFTSEYYAFNSEDSINQVVFNQQRHSLTITLGFRFE